MMLKMSDWKGAVMSREIVDDMIKQVHDTLMQNPDEYFAHTLTGNTLVLGTRYPGEPLEIIVATPRQHGVEFDPYSDPEIIHL